VTHSIFPKPAQVVADKRFLDDKLRVHDSLVALQISPSADTTELALLVNISRAIDLLERVAADDASLRNPGAARSAISRVVVLPPKLFPPAATSTSPRLYRVRQTERMLAGADPAPDSLAAAAAQVTRLPDGRDATLLGDQHASAPYRAHLAEVLTRRALGRALARARDEQDGKR
jgi:hypothetical protein